jgi:uncharacterized OsmC-like protein
MPTAIIQYQGNLRTQPQHVQSGSVLVTDAPTDNHGRGEAFSPTDLTAASLGSCMLTMLGIWADREGIDLSGLACEVTKEMASDPRRIAKVVVRFRFDASGLADKQREVFKRVALTCPVALSLHPDIVQEVHFGF